jgi:hypothetical protein
VLLVAMGNEGLLIHSPLEGWKRTGFYETYSGYTSLVFNTSPTPFKAVTFGDVISYVYEIPLALALGFILFLVFSVIAWVYASRHIFSPEKRPVKWIFRPVWILAIWIIVLALLWGLSGIRINLVQNIVLLILAALTLGFPLAIVVISLVVWHRAIAAASDGQKLIDLRTLILLASGVILVIACVYFPLWAFGIIAAYSTALVLAVITYLVFLAICAYGVRNTLLYPGKT